MHLFSQSHLVTSLHTRGTGYRKSISEKTRYIYIVTQKIQKREMGKRSRGEEEGREGENERDTHRPTARQRERQRHRERGRQTEGQRDTERDTDRERHRQTDWQGERDTERHRQTDMQGDERDRQTETETDRQIYTTRRGKTGGGGGWWVRNSGTWLSTLQPVNQIRFSSVCNERLGRRPIM